MPKKITLTPKDCLYIEDIVNASMLTYKKISLEKEQCQDEDIATYLDNVCTTLKEQATTLTNLLKGAK